MLFLCDDNNVYVFGYIYIGGSMTYLVCVIQFVS